MGAGRPFGTLKFKSVEELQKKIDEYFDSCFADIFARDKKGNVILDEEGKPYKERQQIKPFLMSGLADALDISRQTLINYKNRDNYFDAVMRARRKCEVYAESQLFEGNDRGAKFSLINNYEDWTDKKEITGKDGAPLVGKLEDFFK